MTRFSFAHLADLHLDTPFTGLRGRSSELAKALRDASLAAWDRAVDLCLEAGVDFVVIAGDVYDGEEVGVRAQLRFRDGLARLSAAGVESFVVHGNHDPRGGRWSALGEWPRGVTVFGHEGVTSAPATRAGELLAVVHGISYDQPRVTENLALRYARDPGFGGFQIGLLHCNVGGLGGHENYAPATVDDLRRSGIDYWALGHVHVRTVVCEGRPLAVYPGNLQARHPNETGEKGLYVVEVDGLQPTPRFVPAGTVTFETVSIDIGGGPAGVDEVLAALADAASAREAPTGAAGGHRILRGRVHGSGRAHAGLRAAGEDGLLDYLQDVAPAGVWWDEVRVETRPPLDREARSRAGDFVADLLRTSAELRPGAEAAVERLLAELKANKSVQAVARELDLAGLRDEAAAIWDEAEALALDLLGAAEGT